MSERERLLRRAWVAIAFGTVFVTVSFWSLVYAFVAGAEGGDGSVLAFSLGLALVPFVFVVVAFASGHDEAPVGVVKAMGLALLVGVPLLAILSDVVTGVVAGYAAGGISALAKDRRASLGARWLAVLVVAVVAAASTRLLPALGLALGPALPLTAVGIADLLSIRRYEAAGAG
ncbi:MAG: hypothetical protein R6X29_08500 [Acidimicrobiia bacterium]|jgi:hypothetical protein